MLDSWSSTDTANLRTRVLQGGVALTVQRILGILVTGIGGIALARLLMPELFGIYGVMSFAVGLGAALGELGLGAALLQRRGDDLSSSLGTVFSVQFGASILLGGLVAGTAPLVVGWLNLPAEAVTPLQCLAVVVPLSALRMPGAILLERGLQYVPITVSDLVDAITFHAVAIPAALAGAGVWSFVLGAIAAKVASVAVLWQASRWRPVFRWQWPVLKPLLEFGMSFQGATLLTLVREAVLPIVVVLWSGVTAVGFLNLATSIAFLPLTFVRIAGRVLFPALSRLQDDPARFARAAERALNRIAVVLIPCGLLLLVGAEQIVRLVYGEPWAPAVPAVQLLCVAAVLGGTTGMMTSAFYALGKARFVWWLNVFWTALLWGLSLLLIPSMGFVGYAAASACVSATVVVPAVLLRKLVPIQFMAPIRAPLIAGLASAFLFGVLLHLLANDIPSLMVGAFVALSSYAALVYTMSGALWRADVRDDWRRVLGAYS